MSSGEWGAVILLSYTLSLVALAIWSMMRSEKELWQLKKQRRSRNG